MEEGITKEQLTIRVGIDVSKDKLAVAIASGGVRNGVLSLGTFENTPASVDRLLKKLSGRGAPVSVCCEAGPTGHGLYRQVRAGEDQRHKRQLVFAFMLRHGRGYHRTKPWTMRYRQWLQSQSFDHPAHQLALQQMLQAERNATERHDHLTGHI